MSADYIARGLAAGSHKRSLKSLAIGGQTVVIIGDSIVELNGYLDSPSRQTDIGWFAWANALLGSRFVLLNNAGIGGTRSDTVLANIDSKVLPYAPDWCFIMVGANDANYTVGTSSEVIAAFKANIAASIQKLVAAGVRVLIGTVMPTLSSNTNWSAERVYRVHAMNAFIRTLPYTYPGVVVADFAAAVVDPTSADCQPKTGYLQADDGIHPGHKGAYFMGLVVKEVLENVTPKAPLLVTSVTERYDYNSGIQQLFANPLFQGTGGTNSTTGTITGSIPASCQLQKSGTWGTSYGVSSLEARADGYGNDWVATVTNTGAANDTLVMGSFNLSSRFAAGDRIFATCCLNISGAAQWMGAGLALDVTSGTVYRASHLERSTQDDASAALNTFHQGNVDLVLRTGVITVPAGFTDIRWQVRPRFFSTGGTVVAKLGRVGIWKL